MESLKKELNSLMSFSLTSQGKLKLGSRAATADAVLKNIPPEKIATSEVIRDLFSKTENERIKAVNDAMVSIENDLSKPHFARSNSKNDIDMVKTLERFNRMAVDINSEKREPNVKLIDEDFNIFKISFSAWRMVVGQKTVNNTERVFCEYVYEPHNPKRLIKEQNGIHTVNTYKEPAWRASRIDPKPMPDIFHTFFKHLFPTPETRQYVCAWVANAVIERNETYLVLCGAKGAGKNIFAKMLTRLFGSSNVNNLPVNAYRSKFNSFLVNCQLVIGDEVEINDSREKNIVKRYANVYQAIEEKGRDSYEAQIKCSFLLMSNSPRDLFIEPDDRRFSVVDIADKNLTSSVEASKIESLMEFVDSDHFGASFLKFCRDNAKKDYNTNQPFKGETFKKLVLASLTGWQYAIYNYIVTERPSHFTLGDLDFDWTAYRRKPRFETLETFLRNFTHDGHPMGEILNARSFEDYCIKVNPNFVGIKTKEDDLC